MQHHADRARAVPGDGDAVGVTTERLYVPVHPFQSSHLVFEPVVTWRQLVAST